MSVHQAGGSGPGRHADRSWRWPTRDSQGRGAARPWPTRSWPARTRCWPPTNRTWTAGREAGMSPALLDRLTLTDARISGIADALRQMAALPDPVGEVVRGAHPAQRAGLRQVRVPFGVVGIIYESRPERDRGRGRHLPEVPVTRRCCGDPPPLLDSNAALGGVDARRAHPGRSARGCGAAGGRQQPRVGQGVMRARGLVDVLIPRGGASLIQLGGRPNPRCR